MAADDDIGPDGDHFVVEVAVKQVKWKPSQAAAAGSGRMVEGPRTRHVRTLTKLVTSAAEVEAAVEKAKLVLDIEVGDVG